MTRGRPPRRAEQLDALLTCPLIHHIAADLGRLGRRSRQHPVALHLAYGAMARLFGAANRLDSELDDAEMWRHVMDRYNVGARSAHGQPVRHYARPLTSDTYRHMRIHLLTDDNLEALLESFTHHSVTIANSVGLLLADGPGSRTYPHPTRTVYGDGTVVRPLYRPGSSGRQDLDAAEHTRHDGKIWGNDMVLVSTRGPETHQRVILGVDRVHEVGGEASTAMDLFRKVHAIAGDGIQAVAYDGAFRGVHISTLMEDLGLIVVNKVHPERKEGDERIYRRLPLGVWEHQVGRKTCSHSLVAHAGAVHEAVLTDTGELILSKPLQRKQIRRSPRPATDTWRFALGVVVPCPKEQFVAWVSPHRQTSDDGHGRPDQLRLIPEQDPYFQTIYGLRNDAEAINASYKRTLVADRAAARGWKRQLLDLLSWAILNNSLAWHFHARPDRIERRRSA